MSSNTTWPVSGRLRASPSAPAYARSCARPAGIRFAPRSCVHRPELVVFTAGDDGNGRRQGHAGMHPRARGIYNDPVVPRRHAGSSCPAGNGMLLARAVVVATASTSAATRMPLRRRPPPPRRISSRRAHARSDLRSGQPHWQDESADCACRPGAGSIIWGMLHAGLSSGMYCNL